MPGADIGAHGIPVPRDPYANTAAYVRASALGGSASLNLISPGDGPMTLTVASLDRAYNRSSVATYSINITSTDPTIELLTPNPEFDGWAKFLLQPDPGLQAASPVVGYTVRFSGQTDKTIDVKASADGTGHVRVKLDGVWSNNLTVTSKSEDGWVSGSAFWNHAATVSWTPDQSGFTDLEVYATTSDGLELMPYDYFFTVN